MENVYCMKKFLMTCICCALFLFSALPLFAAEKKEVFLRFSQHDNLIRIVLESDDNSINNTSVIATTNSIKIEFPAIVELKKQQGFIFDTSLKDRFLSISLKNIDDVKSYRLTSPSRIVIDLRTSQKNSSDLKALPGKQEAAKAAEKPDLKAVPGVKPKQDTVKVVEKTVAARIEKPDLKAPQAINPKQDTLKAVEKPAPSKVIFLDAGHGGFDYGITAKDTKEKDLDLIIAKDISSALSKKGHKTFLTRKTDQSLSILERVTLVNSKKPDLFISVHSSFSNAFVVYTAAFDDSATETSAISYSLAAVQRGHIEKSRSMAKAIGKALKDEFKGEVVLRELPLPVLSSINSPAVLIVSIPATECLRPENARPVGRRRCERY